MKALFKHILYLIGITISTVSMMAQDNIEARLNEYESLCQDCLEMKVRISAGKRVSKTEAESKIDNFVNLNNRLKACSVEMSPSQNTRFQAIGMWFTSGVRPKVLDFQKTISPVPLIQGRISKKIYGEIPVHCEFPEEVEGTSHKQKTMTIHVLTSFAMPDFSYGLMTGFQYGRWGGYLSFRSNYVFNDAAYSCSSDGVVSDGSSFWPGGNIKNKNLSASAGILFSAVKWLSVYAGAGYGYRYLQWDDINGCWANVTDWSYSGLAAETGILFTWRKLTFSVGVSTISFRTAAFNCGLGISLPTQRKIY